MIHNGKNSKTKMYELNSMKFLPKNKHFQRILAQFEQLINESHRLAYVEPKKATGCQ